MPKPPKMTLPKNNGVRPVLSYKNPSGSRQEVTVVISDHSIVHAVVSALRDNRVCVGKERKTIDENQYLEADGPFVKIIGPQGCGKSTLARLLCSETYLKNRFFINEDDHRPKIESRFVGTALDKVKDKIVVRVCVVKKNVLKSTPLHDAILILCEQQD